jgi:hypothetical protein
MAKKTATKKETKKVKMSHARLQLEFQPALQAIGSLENMTSKGAFNIIRTRKIVDEVLDTYSKTRKKIAEDLAQKGDDGKPLTEKKAQYNPMTRQEQEVEVYVFANEDVEKEVNEKANQLDAQEVEFEIYPIKYTDIEKCQGLKPNYVAAAGEFVELD